MKEVWKDIMGYEGLYQVSNFGNFKNTITNEALKLSNDRDGYLLVNLARKTYRSHRIVASHFLENPDNLPQVNHKDENKQNNNVDNLEWCSCKYNIRYGNGINKRAKSKSRKVLCKELNIIFNSLTDAANKLNINRANIMSCCKGKLKTSGGYHWEYVN